jgi:hypothetical protein
MCTRMEWILTSIKANVKQVSYRSATPKARKLVFDWLAFHVVFKHINNRTKVSNRTGKYAVMFVGTFWYEIATIFAAKR